MKKIVTVILVISLGFSVYTILNYRMDLNRSQDVVKNLQSIESGIDIKTSNQVETSPGTALEDPQKEETSQLSDSTTNIQVDYTPNPNKALLDEIEDYVGWIEVNDTKINYPVVKTIDNEFYLDHDYYKQENVAGAIFMDRRNLANTFDKHTIIYGHRMNNGSMFTDLDLFLDENYIETNPTILYKDLFKSYEYELLSAFIVSADDYILPYEINQTVIEDFLSRSVYDLDYDFNSNHRFITLSTCNYDVDNGRIIVVGVLR